MLPSRHLLLIAIGLSLLIFLLSSTSSISYRQNSVATSAQSPPVDVLFPRKIWQTWKTPAPDLDAELERFARSWIDMNKDYRYELLTDDSALTYVRQNFKHRQDILQTFENIEADIFQADLIRYLVLLADGGVYTDIDTHCTRPINDWIPSEYMSSASLILGVEFDAQGGEIRGDYVLPVSLGQWTFLAKPGSLALQHVVDQVVTALNGFSQSNQNASTPTYGEVLETTGPAILTRSIFEYLSSQLDRDIQYAEISNLSQPVLLADVLILPISAFASGQDHSGSKPWGNSEQLMSHIWRATWRNHDA